MTTFDKLSISMIYEHSSMGDVLVGRLLFLNDTNSVLKFYLDSGNLY